MPRVHDVECERRPEVAALRTGNATTTEVPASALGGKRNPKARPPTCRERLGLGLGVGLGVGVGVGLGVRIRVRAKAKVRGRARVRVRVRVGIGPAHMQREAALGDGGPLEEGDL